MRELIDLIKKSIQTVKKHYLLLIVVCLIAGFIGTEFTFSTMSIKARMGGEGQETSTMEKVISSVSLNSNDLRMLPITVLDILSGEKNEAEQVVNQIFNKLSSDADTEIYKGISSKKTVTALANVTSSGKAFVNITSYIAESGVEGDFAKIILVLITFAIYEILVCLGLDVYGVVYRRIVLEARTYKKIFTPRFIFLIKVKCWLKVGWALLVKNVCYLLWCLTIVGAFVKRYSYFMVPYVLAENPELKPMEAITISRKIMKGHKWECFYYEMCFMPLILLEILTLGITGIFFSNPLKAAFFAEYYSKIRAKALEEEKVSENLLNDRYLFEIAARELLEKEYSGLAAMEADIAAPAPTYTGVRRFFAKYCGIVLYQDEISQSFSERQSERLHMLRIKAAVDGEAYPTRLSVNESKCKGNWVDKITYIRNYSLLNIVLIFIIASFVGWFWEVLIHIIQTGEFVNRGSMYGPWLPIYGSGTLIMLVFLNRVRNHPIIFMILSMFVCGFIEYMTSYVLEQMYGVQWWNYDGYMLNLNGRICAEGIIAFGILGLAGVYVICPVIDDMLNRVPKRILIICAVILMTAFTCDKIYSDIHPHMGKGISVEIDKTDS